MAKSSWNELIELMKQDDGLPTRTTGPWSFDKLFWWNRYIEITTRAMVGSPQWSELVYVDLFAGPGICTTRVDEDRMPGSPLIAGLAPKPFGRLLLCEADPTLAGACSQRLAQFCPEIPASVISGDCNEVILDIVSEIPDRALTLAFIDPTGLHAHYETIRTLASNRRVDLFILFADSMDIVRNVELYASQTDSNLDLVLGPDSAWRTGWNQLSNQTPTNVAALFADLYKRQLAKLGYLYSADEVLRNSQKVPIYRVVFASKDPRGLDFWNKSVQKERRSDRLF